jgi:hypothetical protein
VASVSIALVALITCSGFSTQYHICLLFRFDWLEKPPLLRILIQSLSLALYMMAFGSLGFSRRPNVSNGTWRSKQQLGKQ